MRRDPADTATDCSRGTQTELRRTSYELWRERHVTYVDEFDDLRQLDVVDVGVLGIRAAARVFAFARHLALRVRVALHLQARLADVEQLETTPVRPSTSSSSPTAGPCGRTAARPDSTAADRPARRARDTRAA